MKSFAILRSIPTDLTWDQIDASAIQNMTNMNITADVNGFDFEPAARQVQWVRTYWEPGSDWATCLYQARDLQAVEDWHNLCEVPYASIREVEVQEDPAAPEDYPRGFHETADDPPLLVVESLTGSAREGSGEQRWIRTYRDPSSGEELQLFALSGPAAPPPPADARIRRVVELRPEDYA